MSRFTGRLRIELAETRDRWAILLEPLVWERDHIGSGDKITIPAGFASDGVTVPRFLWWVIPPWGHHATRAAILHDYLLLTGEPRKEADHQFYLALRAVGVKKWLAWMLWASARVFGIVKELLFVYR